MKVADAQERVAGFKARLGEYKTLIDADIETFARETISQTMEQFGEHSADSMRVFCDVMSRGGKRIRGALTMLAYEMFGGTDQAVAIRAARIMELVQTYLLVVDDVYDRSRTRRGGPTAHVMFEKLHHDHHWKDDAGHFGESIAVNAGIIGNGIAMRELARLDVQPKHLVRAMAILNDNLTVTGEGQANDVFNEVTQTVDEQKVNNVLIWKTAYYTFANPLQFGAVLAGASDEELEELLDFSVEAGRTFQISDDILGVFGDEFESGKSPMDDIREGKRTLLVLYALKRAAKEDAYFLERMLGNHELTAAEFARCKEIISQCGVLEQVKSEAQKSADKALELADTYWGMERPNAALFLRGLIEYLLSRKS